MNYETTRFEDVVHDVDVVVDSMAGETRQTVMADAEARRHSGDACWDSRRLEESAAHGVRGAGIMVKPHFGSVGGNRRRWWIPASSRCSSTPYFRSRKRQELSETGHVRGKIVLRVA